MFKNIDEQVAALADGELLDAMENRTSVFEAMIELAVGPGFEKTPGSALSGLLANYVIGVLSGSVDGTRLRDGEVDHLLFSLQTGYVGECCRQVRERMDNTSSATLREVYRSCPLLMRKVVEVDKEISSVGADKLLRFVLCPALEGNVIEILYLRELWTIEIYTVVQKINQGYPRSSGECIGGVQ